jgi:hypothetical protein
MHYQGLRFEKVPAAEMSLEDMEWLREIQSVKKNDFKKMVARIFDGEWDLRRLPAPAKGLAVTYPEGGKLFIYYLHGSGLFGSLNKEDLLQAARDDGLKGVACITNTTSRRRLLERVGFRVTGFSEGAWDLELDDGQE